MRVSDGGALTPLSAGADDPRSPAVVLEGDARAPLGPGDDDPRSPAHPTAAPIVAPLGPGDATGDNPDDAFEFLVTSPAPPGGTATGARQVVRIPRVTAAPATVAVTDSRDTSVTERQE